MRLSVFSFAAAVILSAGFLAPALSESLNRAISRAPKAIGPVLEQSGSNTILAKTKPENDVSSFQNPVGELQRRGTSLAEAYPQLGAPLYSVTIPEGWTSYDVVRRINLDKTLEGELVSVPAEGTLLPETYPFPSGTTRSEVISQMRDAHDRAIDRLWERRAPDLPLASKAEAVVLASIVEKETGRPEERPLVASVFINRLRRGMRLQSDPTIIYGITKGRGPLDRPIIQSDIDRVTPYNTIR